MHRPSLLRITVGAAISLIAFGLSGTLLRAESNSAKSALHQFLSPTEGSALCYSQAYDAEQLKGQTEPKMTELSFHVVYGKHPDSKDQSDEYRTYWFRLAARPAGATDTLRVAGECNERTSRIWCGVECDGGGFIVHPNSDSKSVRLVFDRLLRTVGSCEAEELSNLDLGTPGRIFELRMADAALCK